MKHCCQLHVFKVICMTVMDSEVDYTSSALSYSHGVPRHINLKEAKYVRQLPMNSISKVSTIMFALLPTDDFIDLQEKYIVFKVKVVVALSDNVL